jgi:hypothetical protein
MLVVLCILLQLASEAAMDALNYRSLKTWAKQAKGLMILSFFALCLATNWQVFGPWYLAWLLGSYCLIRFAIFNPLFNIFAGLPPFYVGTTSLTDRALKLFPLPNIWPFRLFCLCWGIIDIIHLT